MREKILILALMLGTVIYAKDQVKGKGHGDKPGKFEQKGNGHFHKGGDKHFKGNDKTVISIQIGQDGKDKGKGGKHHPNGKGNSDVVFYGHPSGKNKHHDKHHGNGNAYGHYKGGMSGREFGQARAAAARNKHKHYKVVTIGDGRNYLSITIKRNFVLLNLTQRKLVDVRFRLDELHTAGRISTVVYKQKMKKVEVLEKRRAEIEVKVKV